MDAAVVLCVALREVAPPRVRDTDVLEISLAQPAGSVGTVEYTRVRRGRMHGPPALYLLGIHGHTPCQYVRDAVAARHAVRAGNVSVQGCGSANMSSSCCV